MTIDGSLGGGIGQRRSPASRVLGRLVRTLTLASFVSVCAADGRSIATSVADHSAAATVPEARTVQIRLTRNGQSTTATLMDSPTTRDFITLLPMTLTLEDYASTEKIAYLPRKLSTQGAPAGVDPDVGDITYYAPWGNLAIFYRDFSYSEGLITLGRLDSATAAFDVRGLLTVTIEAIEK